jgi:N-acetylmuramoyl-L-alanine amidase
MESIAQKQPLLSLLSFSELHEQIQHRSAPEESAPSWDLFQTERFVRDEVLQLIADRVQSILQADGVMIALAEEDALVCRAASGALLVERGRQLTCDSEFLNQSLFSGQISRSDDCERDPRLQFDLARELGGRASVIVPLRGHRARVGVLQAFSVIPFGFSDDDVRCLDLFGELILSALKPADQDRRMNWLADVADEILRPNGASAEASSEAASETTQQVNAPAVAATTTPVEAVTPSPSLEVAATQPVVEATSVMAEQPAASPAIEDAPPAPAAPVLELCPAEPKPATQTNAVPPVSATPPAAPGEIKFVASKSVRPVPSDSSTEPAHPEKTGASTATAHPRGAQSELPALTNFAKASSASAKHASDAAALSFTSVTDANAVEAKAAAGELAAGLKASFVQPAVSDEASDIASQAPLFGNYAGAESQKGAQGLPDAPTPALLQRLAISTSARPGLSVVIVLVLVAALFSTGVWWGMHNHGLTASDRSAAQHASSPTAPALQNVVAPMSTSAPASDNLLDPMKADSQTAALAPASADKLAVFPKVTGIRHWSSALVSTVAIDMQDQVPYEVHRLTSPERIYFDLHDTALPVELDGKTIEADDPALTRVRIAQPVAGVTRIVLDTRDGANFSVSMESNPYRLVVQLRSGNDRTLLATRTGPPASLDRAPKQTPLSQLPLQASNEPPLPAKAGHFRVVLDAGHGGWDLGTVGRQGLLEKDLVLDVAQRLGKLLQGRLGADIVYTRKGDDYLPLEQRADLANQSQADMFVSVHANYSSSATARGVETYYSNFYAPPATHDTDNNPAHLVRASLSPGELHERVEESRSLAANVQRALYGTLAATNPGIRDRGTKDANFVVLKGTTMPSILTEISFVSSPADEKNLRSESYRQQIAEALYKGISRFEANSRKVKLAQVRSTGK